MTEPTTSGAQEAPAAEPSAPSPGASNAEFGVFGSARGSGLARGKRSGAPSPSAAPAAAGEYKPTALEVITPAREYKNPFTGEVVAGEAEAPAAPAPSAAAEAPVPAQAAAAPAQPPSRPADEAEGEAKLELTILPPAEVARPSLSWESRPGSAGRPEEAGRDRHPRRDDHDRRERRSDRPDYGRERHSEASPDRGAHRPRADEAPKPAARGFFGWLRSLFGGAKQEPAAEPFRDGHRRHRRHRGGRGHYRGPSDGHAPNPGQAGPDGARGDFRGGSPREGGNGQDQYPGGHRRRRRGGRGRHRGDRQEPRREGTQGGGAI